MATIDHYINGIVERASVDAHQDGSATVEAHHLLLAITADTDATMRQALQSVKLNRESLRAALDQEFAQSLRAAGVSLADYALPPSSKGAKGGIRLAASSKLAFERAFGSVARKKDLRPGHLLLGILLAELGTVPRALACAGVDRTALVETLRRGLAAS